MRVSKVWLVMLAFLLSTLPIAARGNRDRAPATSPTATPAPTPSPAPQAPTVRYYQTSAEIAYTYDDVHTMANSGCCFMSCLGIAQTHARRILTAEQINTIRQQCYTAQPRELEEDFYVSNPTAVINRGFVALGVSLTATFLNRTETYQQIECDATLLDGLQSDGDHHFVEGDAYGVEIWNPHPTVTITRITRIYYFRIAGYR